MRRKQCLIEWPGTLVLISVLIGAATSVRSQKGQEPKSEPRRPSAKDSVRYDGQDLSIVEFKNRCQYVDETNFTSAEAEHAVFVEAKLGAAKGDVQTLKLRRHGKEIPLVCRFPRGTLTPRVAKQLKENKIVWAYGWFTDAPTNQAVIEESPGRGDFPPGGDFGGRGRRAGGVGGTPSRELDRVVEYERQFHLISVGTVDIKEAVGKLRTSALAENPTAAIDSGQTINVVVEVANQSSVAVTDVEVQVAMSFSDAFRPNQIVDNIIVDFDRVPGKQSVRKTITLQNHVAAAFIPRTRSNVIHAVTVKE